MVLSFDENPFLCRDGSSIVAELWASSVKDVELTW